MKVDIIMKVKEFIKQSVDIDVFDDICEELYIAFCGPMELTPAGKKHFREVLGYEVELHNNGAAIVGIVHIDDPDDDVWEARLEKAKEFFEACAGYCTVDEFEKWFKE